MSVHASEQEEDYCLGHSCSYYCHRPECVLAQRNELRSSLEHRVHDTYIRGWNSALEMAARKYVEQHHKAFGPDTVESVAIWIKQLKEC